MFTGLVQKIGTLAALRESAGGAVAHIHCEPWPGDPLVPGESVAVQGCCLTVTSVLQGGFLADVLEETLAVSAIGSLPQGSAVNLERALRPCDRLGGHIVQGHVDGIATLVSRTPAGRDWCLRFSCPSEISRYIVRKGSVALDGTSLTVSAVPGPGLFEVCLIPTTLACTSLRDRREGDHVNVETDVLGRYVEAFVRNGGADDSASTSSPITPELLRRAGFDFDQ